jgi:hypothetical protein
MARELQIRRYNEVVERLQRVGFYRLPKVQAPEVTDYRFHVYDPAGSQLAIDNDYRPNQPLTIYDTSEIGTWFEPGTPRK